MFSNQENERIMEALLHQAAESHIPHAFILNAEDPAVVLAAAERLAEALVRTPADILYPEHAKPNLISVEDVREGINRTVQISPYGSDHKVYIVQDADRMNVQAQNALLKTLEEPPAYVVILLLSTDCGAFLQTILSRCVKVTFLPENISNQEADEKGAEIRAAVRKFMESAEFNDIRAVTEFTQFAGKNKTYYREILEEIRTWIRDILLYKASGKGGALIHNRDLSDIKRLSVKMSYEDADRALQLLTETWRMAELNVNFELAIEQVLFAVREAVQEGK